MTRWRIHEWRFCGMLALSLQAGLAWPALAQSAPAASTARSATAAAASAMSLEQAVAKVQNETHGKILRADTRQYGDVPEYRIKVLTPEGHVRVISVRARPTRASEN